MDEKDRRFLIEEIKKRHRSNFFKQLQGHREIKHLLPNSQRILAKLRSRRAEITQVKDVQHYNLCVHRVLESLRNMRRIFREDPADFLEHNVMMILEGLKYRMESKEISPEKIEMIELAEIALLELIAELRQENDR
jgi:hypothetical protein